MVSLTHMLSAVDNTFHCVCFARAGLPIRENSRVKTDQYIVNNWRKSLFKNFRLGREGAVHAIKTKRC